MENIAYLTKSARKRSFNATAFVQCLGPNPILLGRRASHTLRTPEPD